MPHQSHDCNGDDSPPYELGCDEVMSNIRGRDGGYIVDLFTVRYRHGISNLWKMCTNIIPVALD